MNYYIAYYGIHRNCSITGTETVCLSAKTEDEALRKAKEYAFHMEKAREVLDDADWWYYLEDLEEDGL